jgi:hypothetical protein
VQRVRHKGERGRGSSPVAALATAARLALPFLSPSACVRIAHCNSTQGLEGANFPEQKWFQSKRSGGEPSMVRFSKAFGLKALQAELDFVDVDLGVDNRLYLDPYAIQLRHDEWSEGCGDHIRSFFEEVLDALRKKNLARAEHLLSNLHEPNETCLGQSKGKPSGRGVGPEKASDLAKALADSRAFKTGLLTDISEAELFIRNIGPDTISDLTTNILRGLLAEYTKAQCELHGVPTENVAELGPAWSLAQLDWVAGVFRLPRWKQHPILLVPKFSVRRRVSLNSQEFYNHHMIEFLRQEYLQAGGALVRTFKKSGKQHVYKNAVKGVHPFVKDDLAAFVRQHPEILELYKTLKGAQGPLTTRELAEDFDEATFALVLIDRLKQVKVGKAAADEYHTMSMGIATFLFHPHLIYPVKEKPLHGGRKKIDIKFSNTGADGFFKRMLEWNNTRALAVFIECKNYNEDVDNPAFDQLAGRFGHQRGFFGMLFSRRHKDRKTVIDRCRDAANDRRGYLLPLDDEDVIGMLQMVADRQRPRIDRFLNDRFDEITI